MSRCLISRPFLGRVLRFGVVGFSGFLVDFGITALLCNALGWSIVLATGFGFCAGATSNYILNRRWTWRSDNPDVAGEFLKFFGVSLIGLGVHYLVLLGCLSLPGLSFSFFGLFISNDWSAKLVATGVVMVWNFGANNFYTFRGGGSRGHGSF